MIARDRTRIERVLATANGIRALAILTFGNGLVAWSMFLMVNTDFDGEQGVVGATIVQDWQREDDWLRAHPIDLELDAGPEEFTLHAGPRVVATGKDAAALDPERIRWLARWRPRVVMHVEDGMSLAQVVAAMDVLAAAGFDVAFDAEPR